MFTTQHYIAISTLLRLRYATLGMEDIILDFTRLFDNDNERFIPEKFLEACSPNPDQFLVLQELWKDEMLNRGLQL